MLRRNPLAALALHTPALLPQHAAPEKDASAPKTALQGAPGDTALDEASAEAAEDASARLISTRSGDVLGPHTVLKVDHFQVQVPISAVRAPLAEQCAH